jgi:hypothetical protein
VLKINWKIALQVVGAIVLLIGLAGIVTVGVHALAGSETSGAVPACCFVLLMVGLALAKPELLQDDSEQVSTMRVGVLGIVTMFIAVTTKAAWSALDLQHVTLDGSWAWLIAAALGGKALQSFSEYRFPSRPALTTAGDRSSADAPLAKGKTNGATTVIDPTSGPTNRPKL